MNTAAQNTYNSLSPLIWLLKIFGLNSNVEHPSNHKILYFIKTLLTMLVIGCLDSFCLYYKVKYIFVNISPSIKLTDTIQMVYDHFQFLVDLWFINKYGRQISVEYFKQYGTIDLILNMTDYNTIKCKLIKLVCLFSAIWSLSSSLDLAAWYLSYGWLLPLIYSVGNFYLFIKIITTLDLSSHIMQIETRLKIMADLVQNYYEKSENFPGFVENSFWNKNWLQPEAKPALKSAQVDPLKVSSKDESEEVESLKRCYLLLTDQVEFINHMFGIRILLNSLSLLIDIVRFTNVSVRLILGTQKTTFDAGYFPAISSILRMLVCVAVLISLVTHSEKAYYQKDRIVNTIDHLLVNKNPSEKLRTKMNELRDLVLARPISFIMAKFFRLDYNFLISIASVTVTYTIILLQSMN